MPVVGFSLIGLRPSGIGVSVKTVPPLILISAFAKVLNNLLGLTIFSPFLKCEVVQINPFLARVIAT